MSNKTKTPTKHDAIVAEFRAQIEAGQLRPGDRLLSFAEMRARYGVAAQTVDRIYSTLERGGWIVRLPGSGTFVAEQASKPVSAEIESPLLGLVVPAVDQVFWAEIIHGAEDACHELGAHLVIANTRGSAHLEAKHLTSLVNRVAGVAIVPSFEPSYAAYNVLLERELPFVFIDRCLDRLQVPLVAPDHEQMGFVATQHLLELGYRRIHVICGVEMSSVQERLGGYRRALESFGVPFDDSLIFRGHDQEGAGHLGVKHLLESGQSLRALFCINDPIARGAYAALKEAGLSIPEDCAVVACADSNAALMEPPLTGVHTNLRAMGAKAIELLWANLKRGGKTPARAVRLAPELVVRASTAPNSDFCRVRELIEFQSRQATENLIANGRSNRASASRAPAR